MSSDPPAVWRDFAIEQQGTEDGHCDCCGTTTKRVYGFVRRNSTPVGIYVVTWTEGKFDHPAKFDLILGDWGKSAANEDHYLVALDYWPVDGGYAVVDAVNRVTTRLPHAGTPLKRSDVIGTPLASQVFAIVDAVSMCCSVNELYPSRDHLAQ